MIDGRFKRRRIKSTILGSAAICNEENKYSAERYIMKIVSRVGSI